MTPEEITEITTANSMIKKGKELISRGEAKIESIINKSCKAVKSPKTISIKKRMSIASNLRSAVPN